MAGKITLKKSNVANKVPLTTDLDYGELALNYTDGKLYYKNNSNVISSINPFNNSTGAHTWKYNNVTKSIGAQEGNPSGVFFKPDGTKMFVSGYVGDTVYEYALSTPWDISTATYTRNAGTLGFGYVSDVFFRADGLKLYIGDLNNKSVYEYNVTTAWDLTAVTFVQSFSTNAQDSTSPSGIFFKPDGLRMYVTGYTNNKIYEYTLSTAWDISTATYSRASPGVSGTIYQLFSLWMASDGLSLYSVSNYKDSVLYYTLSTAWDISTATFINEFFIGFQEYSANGIFVEPSQNKAWMVGLYTDSVYEYTINNSAITGSVAGTTLAGYLSLDSNANVGGNLRVAGTSLFEGTITLNGIQANTDVFFTGTTGYMWLGSNLTTGQFLLGGTAQTSDLVLGRSTVTQITNLQTGATTTGNTKTINFGTGGLSGSTTAITIGNNTGGATSTTTLNGAITIPGTVNKLTLTPPATGATLTIGDTKTVSFPNSLTFPSTNGTSTQVLSTDGSGGLSWIDQASGPGGGGTTLYKGTATINFGAFPGSNEASIAVTGQSLLGSTPEIKVFINGDDSTTDHTQSDHRYLPLFASFVAGSITAGTGFTIYARSLEKLQGTFKITWEWSN